MSEPDEQGACEALPPEAEATIRVLAMPADTNWHGDIFGGWLMGQVDIAGSIPASKRAHGRVVTVAVKRFEFLRSVSVGDLVSCYAKVTRSGRTSISVAVDVFVDRAPDQFKAAEAELVYVCIDHRGKPRPLPAA